MPPFILGVLFMFTKASVQKRITAYNQTHLTDSDCSLHIFGPHETSGLYVISKLCHLKHDPLYVTRGTPKELDYFMDGLFESHTIGRNPI